MAFLTSLTPVPSEIDDEASEASLPPGHVWAYPCKLPSCPDYGKSWRLRSNFLLHLQEQVAHGDSAKTPTLRREIEIDWRYTTDPYLPPRRAPDFCSQEDPEEHIWNYGFKDNMGRVINGRGIMREIEMHRAWHRRRDEGTVTILDWPGPVGPPQRIVEPKGPSCQIYWCKGVIRNGEERSG